MPCTTATRGGAHAMYYCHVLLPPEGGHMPCTTAMYYCHQRGGTCHVLQPCTTATRGGAHAMYYCHVLLPPEGGAHAMYYCHQRGGTCHVLQSCTIADDPYRAEGRGLTKPHWACKEGLGRAGHHHGQGGLGAIMGKEGWAPSWAGRAGRAHGQGGLGAIMGREGWASSWAGRAGCHHGQGGLGELMSREGWASSWAGRAGRAHQHRGGGAVDWWWLHQAQPAGRHQQLHMLLAKAVLMRGAG